MIGLWNQPKSVRNKSSQRVHSSKTGRIESYVRIRDGLCKSGLQIPPWRPSDWGLQGGWPHMSWMWPRCWGQGHRCWLWMEVCLCNKDVWVIKSRKIWAGHSQTRRTGQGWALQRTPCLKVQACPLSYARPRQQQVIAPSANSPTTTTIPTETGLCWKLLPFCARWQIVWMWPPASWTRLAPSSRESTRWESWRGGHTTPSVQQCSTLLVVKRRCPEPSRRWSRCQRRAWSRSAGASPWSRTSWAWSWRRPPPMTSWQDSLPTSTLPKKSSKLQGWSLGAPKSKVWSVASPPYQWPQPQSSWQAVVQPVPVEGGRLTWDQLLRWIPISFSDWGINHKPNWSFYCWENLALFVFVFCLISGEIGMICWNSTLWMI